MIGPGRRQGEQAACPLPAGGGSLAAAKGRPAEEDGAGAGAGPCQAGLGTGRTAAGDYNASSRAKDVEGGEGGSVGVALAGLATRRPGDVVARVRSGPGFRSHAAPLVYIEPQAEAAEAPTTTSSVDVPHKICIKQS